MKRFSYAIAVFGIATAAHAQEVVLGGGYADYNHAPARDGAIIALEYHHSAFRQSEHFTASFGGALSVDEFSNAHLGVGIVGTYDLGKNWFLEASVMPGIYVEDTPENRLGSRFQIRSLLGIGYTLGSGDKLSVAITHKSNASTTDFNPGVNAVLIRYHKAF